MEGEEVGASREGAVEPGVLHPQSLVEEGEEVVGMQQYQRRRVVVEVEEGEVRVLELVPSYSVAEGAGAGVAEEGEGLDMAAFGR